MDLNEHDDDLDQGVDTMGEADEFEAFLKIVSGEGAEVKEPAEEEDDLPMVPSEEADDDPEDDDEEDAEEDEDSDEDVEDEDDDEEYEDEDDDVEDEDAVDVDYDTLITLPNGEQVTIEDLHKGFVGGEDLKHEKEAFEEERSAFEEQTKDMAEKLELAKLEADRVLDDFKDFDWQKLAMEDPKEFANTKLFVEKYAQRAREIKDAREDMKAQEAEAKKAELESKAQACVAVLEKEVPDWNRDMYSDVIDHAISLGMGKEEALGIVDPGMIKALVNSMKMSTGKKAVKAKIVRKVKAPKKVVSSGSKKRAASKKPAAKADYSSEKGEFDFFKRFL